ncbi:AraC family transcriptional regulator [Hydrogenophaga sp.]|uniref:AraC family transcriptional regulator n=1 Tax=Hydrogenophaga sp. TaxID=1904254 RepID=UPI0026233480|nr:AraC family transcriptional regulator [Hydrogenophaga sp.]MCW5655360.1 AraC family transcriptional regulator [Hydrogenophaga sp.]
MDTDLLSAALRDTGLSRRLLDLSELGSGKALRFPCERSIGLHAVLRGQVHLHAPGLPEPLVLEHGDVAVMARGCDHVLSVQPSLQGLAVERIGVRNPAPVDPSAHTGTVLSSAYQLWHTPLHPFFSEMPAWSVLRASELPRLGPLALLGGLLQAELGGSQPGVDMATQGLLDLLFTYALREVMARCANARAGWSQAVRDPQVGRVLALMHDQPAHAWTLDELARRAGLSRTALAERFRQAMGDTPLNHLRTLRMQRAMKLLSETSQPLEAVATTVGYQDAFSFSKVFKRTVGASPRAFRQQDAAERNMAWRFQAG